MRRHAILLSLVGVLLLTLSVPAVAKKGGNPGPPSGSGLEVTVEPSSGLWWANSVGDEILFDITVTNTSGGDLNLSSVTFGSTQLLEVGDDGAPVPVVLTKDESWTMEYRYTVVSLDGWPVSEQSQVPVGTVTATDGTVTDSADAVMTAYPIEPCTATKLGFAFGPNAEYAECSFTGTGDWTLTTTLAKPPRGKSASPGATVRDGVPGNWCNIDENGKLLQPGEPYLEGGVWKVDSHIYLPAGGTCLNGGAGGEPILVRNTDKFYLATWTGNTVVGEPLPAP